MELLQLCLGFGALLDRGQCQTWLDDKTSEGVRGTEFCGLASVFSLLKGAKLSCPPLSLQIAVAAQWKKFS